MIRPIRNGGFGDLKTHEVLKAQLNSAYHLPGEPIGIRAFDEDGTMPSRKGILENLAR